MAHRRGCPTACGIYPVSPELADRFLTAGPPGKSCATPFRFYHHRSFSVKDSVLERRFSWLVLRFNWTQIVPYHLTFPLPSPLEPSSGTVPREKTVFFLYQVGIFSIQRKCLWQFDSSLLLFSVTPGPLACFLLPLAHLLIPCRSH